MEIEDIQFNENTINLIETSEPTSATSPINEVSKSVPTSVDSTLNSPSFLSNTRPENTTSSNVTSISIELPKEPEVISAPTPININLESKEPTRVISNETSSINNTSTATVTSEIEKLINSGDVINTLNQISSDSETKLNTIFSQTNLDKLNSVLNSNLSTSSSTINPIQNIQNTSNPIDTSNTSIVTRINEVFNQSKIDKLNSILNSSQTVTKNDESIITIPREVSVNQTEVTKNSPSFSEKIAPANSSTVAAVNKEETAVAVAPEISVSPVSEKATSSTSERIERVEKPTDVYQTSIDISPLEQRLARIEYLLSNTLDVKIIN